MERNPNFTKERADFVFNKIKKYYEQNAYKLVLSEVDANRELIGSVLNIGSQLKLNKFVSTSIINIILDAFEVDGNLTEFDNLFSKYRTNIELHAGKEYYMLIKKYQTEREKNPNFKSRKEYFNNNNIHVDKTDFDDDIIEFSLKTLSKKTKTAKQIEKDFLDSIEKPTFMFTPIYDETEQSHVTKKTNIDNSSITEDFFNSIKTPSIQKNKLENEFEQLSFDESAKQSKSSYDNRDKKNKLKKKKTDDGHNQTSIYFNSAEVLESDYKNKLDPISISNTVLAKEKNKEIKKIRGKIKLTEDKLNKDTKTKTEEDNSVLAQRTFVKNGKKGTHTIYKSGGRVTEITIDTQETKNIKNRKIDKPSNNKRKSKINGRDSGKPVKLSTHSADSSLNNNNNDYTNKKERQHNNTNKDKKRKSNKKRFNSKFLFLLVLVSVLAFSVYFFRNNIQSAVQNFTQSLNQNKADNLDNVEVQNKNDTISDEPSPTVENKTETVTQENPEPVYILPSHEREITYEDMANMTKSEVRFAINEMFARHGWHFNQVGDFYNYFMEQDWYKPDLTLETPLQAEKRMSELEVKNLITIKARYDSMR